MQFQKDIAFDIEWGSLAFPFYPLDVKVEIM